MRRAPLLAAGLLLLSLLLLLVALRALSDQEQSVQPGPLKRGGLAAGVSETRPWLEKIAHDQRFERGEGRGVLSMNKSPPAAGTEDGGSVAKAQHMPKAGSAEWQKSAEERRSGGASSSINTLSNNNNNKNNNVNDNNAAADTAGALGKATQATGKDVHRREPSTVAGAGSIVEKGAANAFAINDAVPPPEPLPCNASTCAAGLGYPHRCMRSLKSYPECPGVKALLIVATGRSGTHHATRALSQKRFRVIHEGAGPDGSVGWPYAVYTRHRRYIFEGPVEKIGNQRFVIVGHQVRHPISAIASLASLMTLSWEFIVRHTPSEPRLAETKDRFERALIHWVTWNRAIEEYADFRYRLEDTSMSRVCLVAKLDPHRCKRPVAMTHDSKRRNQPVTWEQLFRVNKEYASAALEMALRYGYQRDPHGSTLGDVDSAESPSEDVFWYPKSR